MPKINIRNIQEKFGSLFREVPLAVPSAKLKTPRERLLNPLSDIQPTPTPTPAQIAKLFRRVTYYLPTGGKTATGTTPRAGYTAAVSPDMLDRVPMGSLVKLPNGITVRVEDKTNSRLKDTLDIFYDTKEQAKYPKGMDKDVAYQIIGRDTSGLKYNY